MQAAAVAHLETVMAKLNADSPTVDEVHCETLAAAASSRCLLNG